MATKIEWVARPGTTPESWNPVTGCTKISEGCRNCYAERMARRLAGRFGYPEAPRHFDVTLRPDRLDAPLRWKKPRTVFVCSMSDLFHEGVSFSYVDAVMETIAKSPQHTFLILTKRPKRMFNYFYGENILDYCDPCVNLWLGVTVENQRAADERRSDFEQVAAAVKFVSYEPALGPVDWTGWEFVDQITSGGESGPGARPSHPDWHRATRDFCQENGISYFMKQWGAWCPIGDYDPETKVYHYSWQHAEPYKQVISIGLDGKVYSNDFPPRQGRHMARVGKHRAGRLLDGREWNEWPR